MKYFVTKLSLLKLRVMERIEFISEHDPVWASKIISFFNDYPEFVKYAYLIPLMRAEPMPYKNVHTLFGGLMFYVCSAGVRFAYALSQWEILYPIISTGTVDLSTMIQKIEQNDKIQPKKKTIYISILRFMRETGVSTFTIQTVEQIKRNVSGVGDGCVAWCKRYFSDDDDWVEYSDGYFVTGFEIMYGTKSAAARKKKAAEWISKGYGRISSLMVMALSYTVNKK